MRILSLLTTVVECGGDLSRVDKDGELIDYVMEQVCSVVMIILLLLSFLFTTCFCLGRRFLTFY